MSKVKYRFKNKLGTGGVIISVLLTITTFILSALLALGLFSRFVSIDALRFQKLLGYLGVGRFDISVMFYTNGLMKILATLPALIVIASLLLLMLVVWTSYYRLSSVYAFRAFRAYSLTTGITGIVIIAAGFLMSPIMSAAASSFYTRYYEAFRVSKWIIAFAAAPIIALSVFAMILGLAAAFPAKNDMKRPSNDGERDVSFIMDDEDIVNLMRDGGVPPAGEPAEASSNAGAVNYPEEDMTKIESVAAEEIKGYKICPVCKNRCAEDSFFCGECGSKL